MNRMLHSLHDLLLLLACLSMVAGFGAVMLGVVARVATLDLPGLDAYAGYCIASAFFLALPATLRSGDHIRVLLLLDRLRAGRRGVLEWWSLLVGVAVALFLCVYSARLVWISWLTHDVSPAADATPLWIPQLAALVGSAGFLIAMAQAIALRISGREFFKPSNETANVE